MVARRKREVLDLPALPKGLATNLGQLMIGALAVVTAVFAFVNGDDHTVQTAVALGGTVVTALTVMGGRYAQSCALLRQIPSPVMPTANGVVAVPGDGRTPVAQAAAPVPIVVHCCCHGHEHRRDDQPSEHT